MAIQITYFKTLSYTSQIVKLVTNGTFQIGNDAKQATFISIRITISASRGQCLTKCSSLYFYFKRRC